MDMKHNFILLFNGMSTYSFLYVQSKLKANDSTNKKINLPILQKNWFFTLLHVKLSTMPVYTAYPKYLN